MNGLERGIHDKRGYLERLSKPLQEKMRIAEFIDRGAKDILDVGCADGVVTDALAHAFPQARVYGIDLDESFIGEATQRAQGAEHTPAYDKVYLRQLLERPERYDAVTFASVLHEFYTYGNREPSVMKAIADAYELLKPGGRIVIRDMILSERMKEATLPALSTIGKIRAHPDMQSRIADFEAAHGPLSSLYSVNHFLLKYMYTDNWDRECPEHYVPVTREQYEQLFAWLKATLVHRTTYLIPYLRETWRNDFGLTDTELMNFFSTTILVAEKPRDSDAFAPTR